ncbi:MAG: sigma-54-dependent Fis family transcriptional regulator [Gemmatimonadetes bacterium]|nr:sigma-54-dependent Fis family transcriptional regulator [Gemmatimonadota bacterium]
MKPTVLIVDDEVAIRRSLAHFFLRKDFHVLEAGTPDDAFRHVQASAPDVVLLDLRLPGMDGLALLEELKRSDDSLAVIIMTGHGDINTAVEAMKRGAENFLPKPVDLNQLFVTAEKALEKVKLHRKARFYQQKAASDEVRTLGISEAMKRIEETLRLVARNADTTVLLMGESGTGKGFAAEWIHQHSSRSDQPFVEVNAAGLSATFLESELFGHEKGAFTDARQMKRGLLEVADGGTAFLDEIGDLDPALQPKLLKVLESKSFRRLGGTEMIRVDVRLIVATNVDLARKMQEGKFRQDLYYRLKVMPVTIPPLRQRPEDVDELARSFLQDYSQRLKGEALAFTPESLRLLRDYEWPGNVRELRNVVERAVILCEGGPVGPVHLPHEITRGRGLDPAAEASFFTGDPQPLEEVEKRYIGRVLDYCEGNRSQAAQLLAIARSTLINKIKKYELNGAVDGASAGRDESYEEGTDAAQDDAHHELDAVRTR